MKASITKDLLTKTLRTGRAVTIFDSRQPGLQLRILASGAATYRVALGARGQFLKLGKAADLEPDQARELARRARGDVAYGKDPIAEKRKARAATLRDYLDGDYLTWAAANQKHAQEWIDRIEAAFPDLLPKPLSAVTAWQIEQWRAARKKEGITPATIERDLNALRSVFSRAVKDRIVKDHPLRDVKRTRIDTIGRLRFLSPDEEKRLRAALETREQDRRDARARFNAWRRERGYKTIPDFAPGAYVDHLQPIVLLALNTGLRRGELLGLRWGDVDRVGALLTVRGASAKTGRTRYVPLNTEVLKTLKTWRPNDATDDDLVFPGDDGEPMFSLKTAWGKVAKAAGLHGFTFHDLRHTFASKLVQAGVDLNTVRELLGHTDIKMTLRYAHLAPEHRAAAVAKLIAG
jgi:integrase